MLSISILRNLLKFAMQAMALSSVATKPLTDWAFNTKHTNDQSVPELQILQSLAWTIFSLQCIARKNLMRLRLTVLDLFGLPQPHIRPMLVDKAKPRRSSQPLHGQHIFGSGRSNIWFVGPPASGGDMHKSKMYAVHARWHHLCPMGDVMDWMQTLRAFAHFTTRSARRQGAGGAPF